MYDERASCAGAVRFHWFLLWGFSFVLKFWCFGDEWFSLLIFSIDSSQLLREGEVMFDSTSPKLISVVRFVNTIFYGSLPSCFGFAAFPSFFFVFSASASPNIPTSKKVGMCVWHRVHRLIQCYFRENRIRWMRFDLHTPSNVRWIRMWSFRDFILFLRTRFFFFFLFCRLSLFGSWHCIAASIWHWIFPNFRVSHTTHESVFILHSIFFIAAKISLKYVNTGWKMNRSDERVCSPQRSTYAKQNKTKNK